MGFFYPPPHTVFPINVIGQSKYTIQDSCPRWPQNVHTHNYNVLFPTLLTGHLCLSLIYSFNQEPQVLCNINKSRVFKFLSISDVHPLKGFQSLLDPLMGFTVEPTFGLFGSGFKLRMILDGLRTSQDLDALCIMLHYPQ